MNAYEDITSSFPGVAWTGGSSIHASIASGGEMHVPFSNRGLILSLLQDAQAGWHIWRLLNSHFDKMEWLLEGDTFAKLFLVDVNLNLQGQPTSLSPDRLQNPTTGNLFHRIAVLAPYVGGIRFWAEETGGGVEIGYRFRIEKMKTGDEEVKVREEAQARGAQVLVDIESVYEAVLEISEPPSLSEKAEAGKLMEKLG